jgi:hypothetical protein
MRRSADFVFGINQFKLLNEIKFKARNGSQSPVIVNGEATLKATRPVAPSVGYFHGRAR